MTWSLVSILVCSYDSDILKVPDGYCSSVRNKHDCNRSWLVWSVHSTPGLIKVDHIAVLSVHQFNHITLRATEQGWSFICGQNIFQWILLQLHNTTMKWHRILKQSIVSCLQISNLVYTFRHSYSWIWNE